MRFLAASMHDYYPSYMRSQSAVMQASKQGSDLYLTSRCASKLARSSANQSTKSLLLPWLYCPFMHESCDKNVIKPLREEMAGWKKPKPEASPAGIFPPVGCRRCQRWDTCPVDLYLYSSWQESPTLALNPGFPFRILSHSFGERKAWVRGYAHLTSLRYRR